MPKKVTLKKVPETFAPKVVRDEKIDYAERYIRHLEEEIQILRQDLAQRNEQLLSRDKPEVKVEFPREFIPQRGYKSRAQRRLELEERDRRLANMYKTQVPTGVNPEDLSAQVDALGTEDEEVTVE